MILSFVLTMPSNNAWDSRWSGSENFYCICRSFRGKAGEQQASDLIGRHCYDFGDGWSASVEAKVVGAREAAKLRRLSSGFCGYDWMVDSLLKDRRIIPPSRRAV